MILIVVYSTHNCPNCRLLKSILKKFGIGFIEKDLDDSNVMAELIMNNVSVMSAPVIQIGNSVFEFKGTLP